jgi:hypothetical protein
MRIFVTALVAASALSTGAFAAEGAVLKLQGPQQGPTLIQDGAMWRCNGEVCAAPQVKSLPIGRACRKVAAELGAVAPSTIAAGAGRRRPGRLQHGRQAVRRRSNRSRSTNRGGPPGGPPLFLAYLRPEGLGSVTGGLGVCLPPTSIPPIRAKDSMAWFILDTFIGGVSQTCLKSRQAVGPGDARGLQGLPPS